MTDNTQTVQDNTHELILKAREYLQSTESYEKYTKISDELQIPQDKKKWVSPLVYGAVKGLHKFDAVSGLYQEKIGLDKAAADKLLLKIAQEILSGSPEVPGLKAFLESLGIVAEKRVIKKEVVKPGSKDEFVEKFVDSFPERLDDRIKGRIKKIWLDYLNEKESAKHTTYLLQKPVKVGGIEATPEGAVVMIKMFDEKVKSAVFIEDKVKKDRVDTKKIKQDILKNEIIKKVLRNNAVSEKKVPNKMIKKEPVLDKSSVGEVNKAGENQKKHSVVQSVEPVKLKEVPKAKIDKKDSKVIQKVLPKKFSKEQVSTKPVISSRKVSAVLDDVKTVSSKPKKHVIDAFTDRDKQEVEQIKKEKSNVFSVPKGKVTIEQIVKNVCDNPAFSVNDPELKKRCYNIIDSRLRNVRDAYETRRQLEHGVESGGVGIKGKQLADIMELIEKAVDVYKKESGASVEKAIKEKKEQAKKDRVAKIDEKKVKASTELDERYKQITKTIKKAVVENKRAVNDLRPKTATGRPVVSDVRFTRKLSGPSDELRIMSSIEFRRLSSDPSKAITKIKDKVDLLENEGYDKKIQAIDAWRESPMNQLYVSISREALLNGMSIQSVIDKYKQDGKDVLSLEEFQSIMKLNSQLRF